MSLKRSYTLFAPFYDLIVAAPAFDRARQASLRALDASSASDVLLSGVGTGLDLPYLPRAHRYVALDLTRAMLTRALPRASALDVSWVQGNSQALPFADEFFDHVVLHLIVAVVPRPERVLAEAARVTKRGGTLLVFDKFLPRGSRATLRRLLNPIASRIATRTDVVFEDVLEAVPHVRVVGDAPAFARGWFRLIRLQKSDAPSGSRR
jgi:phosphatidylethanolamine/phosphatidyl-N-methylethanolamine N-methyltransferase